MRCYVINLEKDTERRATMQVQLQAMELDYNLFNAVDGRKLTSDEVAKLYDAPRAAHEYREMTRSEIGCALSHTGVYADMLRTQQDYAMVLEDDALLGKDVKRVLEALSKQFKPSEPVVVLLSHIDKYTHWGKLPLTTDHQLVNRYAYWWLAHGYFLTKAAAESLSVALRPVWTAADAWATFEDKGIVKLHAVVPYCVSLTEHARQSNIESTRVTHQAENERQRSWKFYVKKYLYDRFIHQIAVRPFLRVSKQRANW